MMADHTNSVEAFTVTQGAVMSTTSADLASLPFTN
jgi:hypothetical protein